MKGLEYNSDSPIEVLKNIGHRYDVGNRSVFVIGTSLNDEILDNLVTYKNQHTLENKQFVDGDCARVAGEAAKSFSKNRVFSDYHHTTIGTDAHEKPIPLYKNVGYKYHVINAFIGGDECFAVDLTLAYSLPELDSDVLIVVASSEEDLLRKMKEISGVSWELRD